MDVDVIAALTSLAWAGKLVIAPTLADGDRWDVATRTEVAVEGGHDVAVFGTVREVTSGGTFRAGTLAWDERVGWVMGRRVRGERVAEWSSQTGRAPGSDWWALAERVGQEWHTEVDWYAGVRVTVASLEVEDAEAAMARRYLERKLAEAVTAETAADVAAWPVGTFRRHPVSVRGPAPPDVLPGREVERTWTLREVSTDTVTLDEVVALVPRPGTDPVLVFSGSGSVVVDRHTGVATVHESHWTWSERSATGATSRDVRRTVTRERQAP